MKDPEASIDMALDCILETLDILACKVIDRRYAAEVIPHKVKLRQVGVRAELIQRLIDAIDPIGKPRIFRQ